MLAQEHRVHALRVDAPELVLLELERLVLEGALELVRLEREHLGHAVLVDRETPARARRVHVPELERRAHALRDDALELARLKLEEP